jgi:hypothetical protein
MQPPFCLASASASALRVLSPSDPTPMAIVQPGTLKELANSANAIVRPNAKAIEIVFDEQSRRATGVAYLNLTNPDDPKLESATGNMIIVSCGAVHLVQFIQAAKQSLDVAIYDLKEPNVLAALKAAASKVRLRIRYDGGTGPKIGRTSTTVAPKSPSAAAIKAASLSKFAESIHSAVIRSSRRGARRAPHEQAPRRACIPSRSFSDLADGPRHLRVV